MTVNQYYKWFKKRDWPAVYEQCFTKIVMII